MAIPFNKCSITFIRHNDFERDSTKQFQLLQEKNIKHIPAAGAAPPAAAPPAAAGAATAPPAGTEANLERPMRKEKKWENH